MTKLEKIEFFLISIENMTNKKDLNMNLFGNEFERNLEKLSLDREDLMRVIIRETSVAGVLFDNHYTHLCSKFSKLFHVKNSFDILEYFITNNYLDISLLSEDKTALNNLLKISLKAHLTNWTNDYNGILDNILENTEEDDLFTFFIDGEISSLVSEELSDYFLSKTISREKDYSQIDEGRLKNILYFLLKIRILLSNEAFEHVWGDFTLGLKEEEVNFLHTKLNQTYFINEAQE